MSLVMTVVNDCANCDVIIHIDKLRGFAANARFAETDAEHVQIAKCPKVLLLLG